MCKGGCCINWRSLGLWARDLITILQPVRLFYSCFVCRCGIVRDSLWALCASFFMDTLFYIHRNEKLPNDSLSR